MDAMDAQACIVPFLAAVISGAIGLAIGRARGRPEAGFLWGFFLSFIGWLVIALGPDLRPKCRLCGGVVVEGSAKCKNCGSDLPPTAVEGT